MNYYISIPPDNTGNPFLKILNKRMFENGWGTLDKEFVLNTRYLIKYRSQARVLYFHFPESLWRTSNLIISYIKGVRFIYYVLLAKLLGYKLVWSAHNTMPHSYKSRFLEVFLRKFILNTFNLVVNHSYNSEDELESAFGRKGKKHVLALHGQYEDYYSPQGKITKQTLNIPSDNKIIYLNAGKAYKGDTNFINSFIELNIPQLTLLVTGKGIKDKDKLGRHKNIILIDDYISNDEMADILTLCDVVVFSYNKITTSGFYFLALTFSKGVLATDLPFFRLHSSPASILLFNNESSLEAALHKISKGWLPDETQLKNLKEKYNWEVSAKIIAGEFNKLIAIN